MAEEPKKDPEIDAILSDLDVILSDIAEPIGAPAAASAPVPASTPAPVAPPTPPMPAAAPPPAQAPALAPKIELAPKAPPAVPAPAAAPPPPPPVAKAPEPGLKIELAPRAGSLPPAPKPAPAKAAPPPKPAAVSPTPPAPAPAVPPPAPAAAPAAASAKPMEGAPIPEKTPKDQIRRVALLYTPAVEKECAAFGAFLDQSALTVSKKPLFLRKVIVESVGAAYDTAGLIARMGQAKAVAAIVIADSAAENKIRELQDALSTAGLALHTVAPAEIQKRSVAVDIIVDLMLLSGET